MKLKHLALILFMVINQLASADEVDLRQKIEKAYPKFTVESVVKTPYAGLYEVFMGGQIIYTDETLTFLIAEGQLVDPKTKQNITGGRLAELNKIDFNSLPLNKAIKVVKGDGSRQIAVFSDVDCPFCKRLEQNELSHLTDVTIYTFLYPLEQLHPNAIEKSKLIWCAEDRVIAWNEWVFKNKLPKTAGDCNVPLEEIGNLAKKLGITSTPTLIFSDGKRLPGAQPYKEIEAAMQSAMKK